MNLQGDFEGLFLTSILQLLCSDQKTGLLRVTSGKNESRVFFDQGTIVYASGSQKEARLGYILRRDGIISAQKLEKCLSEGRQKKLSLGRILVDKGYVSLKILEKYNTKQVEEILYNLLLWKKGKFEYKDARLNLAGMVVTQLNPMKLILEASRRIDEMSVLETVITSDKLIFIISGNVDNKDEIKLNANEWRILSLIDGSRTIRQIITKSGYDEFAVYKIFFSLISYGVIEPRAEVEFSDEDYSAIITVYNDIFQGVNKQIEAELGDRTASIFEESKSELDPSFKSLLEKYDPAKESSRNIKAIIEAMNKIDDPEQRRDDLINAFNGYCILVLQRIAAILGINPVRKIVEEIENIIGYVKKYHKESPEKSRIVNDLVTMMGQLQSRLDEKQEKKSKGIFSLFRH